MACFQCSRFLQFGLLIFVFIAILVPFTPFISHAGLVLNELTPGQRVVINANCDSPPRVSGGEVEPARGCDTLTVTVSESRQLVGSDGTIYRQECATGPGGGGASLAPTECHYVVSGQVEGDNTEETEPTPSRGLVPCGGTGQQPCQACHVIDLTNNVIGWLVIILGTIAAIIIVYAGAKLVTANGNQRAMEDAKSMVNNMIIGYVIVLAGWLLVDTVLKAVLNEGQYGVWNQVQCVVQPVVENNPYVPVYSDPSASLLGTYSWVNVTTPNWATGAVQSTCDAIGVTSTGLAYNCAPQVAQCQATLGKAEVSADGSTVTCTPIEITASGSGTCEVVSDPNNACHPSRMTCFGDANSASQICNLESSGGNTQAMSGTDLCSDGASFSGGLWQINILANNRLLPGCSSDFFTVTNSAGNACDEDGISAQGGCLECKSNSKGVPYCAMWNCRIKTDTASINMYNYCVQQTKTPAVNTAAACSLYQNNGWQPWLTSARACNVI